MKYSSLYRKNEKSHLCFMGEIHMGTWITGTSDRIPTVNNSGNIEILDQKHNNMHSHSLYQLGR